MIKSVIIVALMLIASNASLSDATSERSDFPKVYTLSKGILAGRIFEQLDDMRELFCDSEVLKSRIKRKMVVLDMQGFVAKSEKSVDSKEVLVEKRISMHEFLDMVGLSQWKRGQPQIKLIRQNSILQSPLFGNHTNEDREVFLQAWVEPGDIVLVARLL